MYRDWSVCWTHHTKYRGLRDILLNSLSCKLQGTYEPGKRHWLKVKKDYLAEGSMADSADLIVLGAYFGTGNKGACAES